jgi:hypothetical protein
VLLPRSNANYIVTVTDAHGCFDADTVRVSVYDPPQVDAGDNIALCAGSAGQLKGRVSGGKKPYTYEWSPRTGLGSAAVLDPSVRPEGTGWYVLSVRDGNGCLVKDSVLVTLHPQTVLQVAADVTVCSGLATQIGAEAVGGTPPYRYRWTPAAGLDNASSAMPQAAPSRKYDLHGQCRRRQRLHGKRNRAGWTSAGTRTQISRPPSDLRGCIGGTDGQCAQRFAAIYVCVDAAHRT